MSKQETGEFAVYSVAYVVRNAMGIWQDLVDTHAFAGGYLRRCGIGNKRQRNSISDGYIGLAGWHISCSKARGRFISKVRD